MQPQLIATVAFLFYSHSVSKLRMVGESEVTNPGLGSSKTTWVVWLKSMILSLSLLAQWKMFANYTFKCHAICCCDFYKMRKDEDQKERENISLSSPSSSFRNQDVVDDMGTLHWKLKRFWSCLKISRGRYKLYGPDHLQLTFLNCNTESVLALNKKLKVKWKFQFFI